MELKYSKTLDLIFNYVDRHIAQFKQVLKEAVSIESISSNPNNRKECLAMMTWARCKLERLGAEVEQCEVGVETLKDGRTLRLPPILLARIGNEPDLPTICFYGHLDVEPALDIDAWYSHPFKMTEIEGKLYGRGTSDNKGPILCWMNAVQAYRELELPLPANLKFICHTLNEWESEDIEKLIRERKGSFLVDVNTVCISENNWLSPDKPCLAYGVRGLCCFSVEIQCASNDLHSGQHGGVVQEAMFDMVYLMNTLMDRNGRILVPNIYDNVEPVTEQELLFNKMVTFNLVGYKKQLGTNSLMHDEDKASILMHRWRLPSLTIHRIEGGNAENSTTMLIPRMVTAYFSLRIVPRQDPVKIEELVTNHLKEHWTKRESGNKLKVRMTRSIRPWATDPTNGNYQAAARAIKRVYRMTPDMIREGGSIPVTSVLQELLDTSIIIIPIGSSDDAIHSQNEKIDIKNYIEGTKVIAAYIYEYAKAHIRAANNE